MITILLKGGLGNQMFQYAAGKALSAHLNTGLKIDLLLYHKTTTGVERRFELDIFSSDLVYSSSLKNRLFLKLMYFFRDKKHFFHPFGFFSDSRSLAYDCKFEQLEDGTTLFGYFQNENYFKRYESLIRNDFQFKNPPDEKNALITKDITAVNSVSLHVRRGDYMTEANSVIFTVCDAEYYEKAIAYIEQKVDKPHFFVFSEDVEWAKTNIDFRDLPVSFVSFNRGDDSCKDMQLMSLCKHNIIANSSFSWWGAWLNNNSRKIVIAPKQWLKTDFAYNTFRGYVPDEWLRM